MSHFVAFAPGAEQNPLALQLRDAIASRAAADERRGRTLGMMRAAVAVVAHDRRLSVTLRFDFGELIIHDGMIGVPDLTLCGDYEELLALSRRPLSRWLRLPLTRAWRGVVRRVLDGRLEIYGLAGHPRLCLRLLRLLAPDP